MDTPRVLAVDDDPSILKIIQLSLDGAVDVITASRGREAIELAQIEKPDVMLLDVMMPDISGIEVMTTVRSHANVPVIMLTARDATKDMVTALDLGADDYITKPFSPDEILARVHAVLRRRASAGEESPQRIVRCGDVEIDLDRRLVTKAGRRVELTRTEWFVVQALAANAGKALLNAQILSKVWGPEYVGDLAYLRVWISRLRQKLEDDPSDPKVIQTVSRTGYVLVAD